MNKLETLQWAKKEGLDLSSKGYDILKCCNELIKYSLTKECDPNPILELNKKELRSFLSFAVNKKFETPLFDLINQYNIKISSSYYKELKERVDFIQTHYYKVCILEKELAELLEANHIRFIYFKGTEMRPLYKYANYRVSNDIDLYIDRKDLEKTAELLKQIYNISHIEFTQSEDNPILISDYDVKLELHTKIVTYLSGNKALSQFEDPFTMCVPDNHNKYKYHFIKEWYYIYNIIHFVKHMTMHDWWFPNITDTYLLSKQELDLNKINQVMNDLDLTTCYESTLAFVDLFVNFVFSKKALCVLNLLKLNEVEKVFNNYSTLGKPTISNLFKNIFNKQRMIEKYPKLEKHLILYPFYCIARFFSLLKKHGKHPIKNMKAGSKKNKDKVKNMAIESGLEPFFNNLYRNNK